MLKVNKMVGEIMLPKVSVVVPIYKVEKYLKRCVDSILNQTYKNIEVILVDDGSPDRCGKIIDEYEKRENRVKAVHKENGGLSDARNYGMRYVEGELLLFVDSDDWLDWNMIEVMVKNILEYKADVVQSAFYYAYHDHLLFDKNEEQKPYILDRKTLMSELIINEKVKNFAWGKLYKTSLIKDIPFKKGVLFEDVFWAHHVMHKVNTYVILHEPMYYYMQRDDSIVANYTTRNLDMIKGLKERHHFIEDNYAELTNESYKAIFKACLTHHDLLLINKEVDQGGNHRKDIQSYIKKNYLNIKKAVKEDPQLSKQLLLFNIHPHLNVLFIFVNKIMRKLKFISQPKMLERIDL